MGVTARQVAAVKKPKPTRPKKARFPDRGAERTAWWKPSPLGGPQLSRPTRPTQKGRRRTIPSKEETSQRPKQKHCLHGRVKPRSAENGGAQDPTLHALLLLGTGRAYPAYVPGSLPENPSLTCATYFQSANEAPAKLLETPQSSNEHRNADQGQIQNPKPDARVTDTRGRTHTHDRAQKTLIIDFT